MNQAKENAQRRKELAKKQADRIKELEEEIRKFEMENGLARTCDECGKYMKQGYCIEGGLEYYCSEECLHKHYTPEQREKMYGDGETDSYRTEREE